MATQPNVSSLDDLLQHSNATPEFKDAVKDLSRGENQDLIEFNWGAPPIKVLRMLMKLLETMPEEPIEKVHIKGSAGCSNFTGTALVEPGEIQIEFDWDCRWQAQEMGWKDCFGEPDQIRAAHEFDYQCFRVFKAKAATPKS